MTTDNKDNKLSIGSSTFAVVTQYAVVEQGSE